MKERLGTILIVDDNVAILTALKICLEGVFDNVITLSSPDKILTTLQQEEISLVLLDMNFTKLSREPLASPEGMRMHNFSLGMNSGQDGLLWLRAIKKHHPDLSVVLITAYADVHLAVKGLKSGAADFVTKPWDNDELIRTLKDAVDNSLNVVPLDQLEAEHVRKVVDKCHGNISKAAELLGISRQTLYNKMVPSKSPRGETS